MTGWVYEGKVIGGTGKRSSEMGGMVLAYLALSFDLPCRESEPRTNRYFAGNYPGIFKDVDIYEESRLRVGSRVTGRARYHRLLVVSQYILG